MKPEKSKLKVEFIDDNDEFLDQWRSLFRKAAPNDYIEVVNRPRDDIQKAVKELDEVRRRARKPKAEPFNPNAAPYADADIVLVDYDLIELEDTTCLTGEDIAYLLRCFSTCGLIVLLNPPDLGTNFFDLRLRRSMDSWADLVLGSDQLDNHWLWSNQPSGFAPWSWPNLAKSVSRRHKQIQSLQQAHDKSVFEVFGFPPDVSMDHAMSDVVSKRVSALESGPGSSKNKPYSVREFVLDSGYAVHRRDKPALETDDEQIAQIAAARLSSWLEYVVLPAQCVLVDAPHLVSRLPGLLAGDSSKVASWNATCTRDDLNVGDSIRHRNIQSYRFSEVHWLSRPAWFWPQMVIDNKRYHEWAQTKDTQDLVFCEDTSSFGKRSQAQQFMADVPAQFALRYVQMRKLSEKKGKVVYRPSVRLTM